MYYELYVDVLFLVNFMMDYLLLLLVRRMMKCSATHGNVCIGAALGAFLTCVVVVLPISYGLKFILLYLFVNTLMLIVGLKIRQIGTFVKAMVLLYIGTFLLGGIMGYVHQYIKVGSLFFGVAILGYYVVLGIWNYVSYLQRMQRNVCKTELYLHGKVLTVQGMIDTGNGLRDPYTNKPVSIIDKYTAQKVFGNSMPEGIRYIPYHSIGQNAGVLPMVQFDKMCVYRKDTCWMEAPLIAISEEKISAEGEYEMILNPNLF